MKNNKNYKSRSEAIKQFMVDSTGHIPSRRQRIQKFYGSSILPTRQEQIRKLFPESKLCREIEE